VFASNLHAFVPWKLPGRFSTRKEIIYDQVHFVNFIFLAQRLRISILVTSFLRPGYLKDCLAGIEKNLSECEVIVVDDSGPQHFDDQTERRFIRLPFDSGLSAKRNAGVKACATKYLLMGSDDLDFSTVEARAGIEQLLRVLDEHPTVDVAGGHHNNQQYEGFLEIVPGSYIRGKQRFKAYGTVFDALKPEGYFVIGDLFPRGKTDTDHFLERSTLMNELDQGGSGRCHYQIKVLRKA
jgi:hypothetical protein